MLIDVLTAYASQLSGSKTTASEKANQEARLKEYEIKLRMLQDLNEQIAKAQRDQDATVLKVYQEQMRSYTDLMEARGRLMSTLVETQGRLSQEQMKQAGADLRSIRDNMTRLLTTYGNRGRGIYDNVVRAAAGNNVNMANLDKAETRAAMAAYFNATANPEDPATWAAYQLLQQAGVEGLDATIGQNAKAAYDNAQAQLKSVKEEEAKLASGTYDPNNLQLSLDALGSTVAPTFGGVKSEVSATTEVGSTVSRLEDKATDLEKELEGLQDIVPSEDKIAGLSRTEFNAILSNPSFRAWAEARGYKLGEMRDTGYVPKPGDIAAITQAAREMAGLPTFRRGKPGDVAEVQIAIPTDAKVARFTITDKSAEGDIKKGFYYLTDGRVMEIDFQTGTVTQVSGEKLKEAESKREESFIPATEKGGDALGIEDMQALVEEGKGLDLTKLEEGADPSVRLETVQGRRLPPQLGDNVDLTMRVMGSDGREVVLKRKSKDDDWVVMSGSIRSLDVAGFESGNWERDRNRDDRRAARYERREERRDNRADRQNDRLENRNDRKEKRANDGKLGLMERFKAVVDRLEQEKKDRKDSKTPPPVVAPPVDTGVPPSRTVGTVATLEQASGFFPKPPSEYYEIPELDLTVPLEPPLTPEQQAAVDAYKKNAAARVERKRKSDEMVAGIIEEQKKPETSRAFDRAMDKFVEKNKPPETDTEDLQPPDKPTYTGALPGGYSPKAARGRMSERQMTQKYDRPMNSKEYQEVAGMPSRLEADTSMMEKNTTTVPQDAALTKEQKKAEAMKRIVGLLIKRPPPGQK